MSLVIMPFSTHQIKNESGQNVYNELISGWLLAYSELNMLIVINDFSGLPSQIGILGSG